MAEPEKRCPRCGAVLPEGFSYCPDCHFLRDDGTIDGAPVNHANRGRLRLAILLATLGLVALLLIFILPRLADRGTDRGAETPAAAVGTTEEETETKEQESAPGTTEPAETEDSGATVDTVVAVPGEDGHTHLYVAKKTVQPGCTEEGAVTYVCSECGASYIQAIPAKGHRWQDATCTEPRTCVACGASEGLPLGHRLAGGVCTVCGFNQMREDELLAETSRYNAEKEAIEAAYRDGVRAIQESDDVQEMQRLSGEIEKKTREIAEEMDESERQRLSEIKTTMEKQYNDLALFINQKLGEEESKKTAALEQAESNHQANVRAINEKYS